MIDPYFTWVIQLTISLEQWWLLFESNFVTFTPLEHWPRSQSILKFQNCTLNISLTLILGNKPAKYRYLFDCSLKIFILCFWTKIIADYLTCIHDSINPFTIIIVNKCLNKFKLKTLSIFTQYDRAEKHFSVGGAGTNTASCIRTNYDRERTHKTSHSFYLCGYFKTFFIHVKVRMSIERVLSLTSSDSFAPLALQNYLWILWKIFKWTQIFARITLANPERNFFWSYCIYEILGE